MEDDNSQPLLAPASNSNDNELADSERSMAGETSGRSRDQTLDNVQSSLTFLSPRPDAAKTSPRATDNDLSGVAYSEQLPRQSGHHASENLQPCPTLLLPHRSDAANPLSPGLSVALGVTSPRPSTSTKGLLTVVGYNSGHHSPSPNIFSESNTAIEEAFPTPSGKPGAAVMTARRGEEGVSQHPTCWKVASRSASKDELQVAPDEHTIVDDALLKCTPYIVNVKYMVIICTDCRHCIIPDRALEHLRKEHSHCKVDTTFSERLKQMFPGLVAEAIHPPETVKAIFGLAISDDKYVVCSHCRRGYVDVSSWKHHRCKNPDTDLAGGHEHFQSHVQTFFRGPRICYFPVELPVLVSDGMNDFDLFKTDFQELAVSPSEIHESEDYRELNQFLQKEGWINHVLGCSPTELSLLTCLPKEGEVLKSAGSDITDLMLNIQTCIGNAGYHVRRLLGRRPAYVLSFCVSYHIID